MTKQNKCGLSCSPSEVPSNEIMFINPHRSKNFSRACASIADDVSVISTHLWLTKASVVFDTQSDEGFNVLNTFNTEPPGIARVNDPFVKIASFAAFSTIWCTAYMRL